MNSSSTVERLLDELRALYGTEEEAKTRCPSHAISLADLQRLFASAIQTSRIVSQEARLTMVNGDRASVASTLLQTATLSGAYLDAIGNSLLMKSFQQQAMQAKQFTTTDGTTPEESGEKNGNDDDVKNSQQQKQSPHQLPIGRVVAPTDAPLTLESLLEDNNFTTIDLHMPPPPSSSSAAPGHHRTPSTTTNPPSPVASALLILAEVHYARFLVDSTLRDMHVLISKNTPSSSKSDENSHHSMEEITAVLNRASHYGAKVIMESDIISRCHQRLEGLSTILMVLDGRAIDAGGCWGEIEAEFQTSVPVAKAQMSQCVIKSRLGRHRDAMRHATISVMLLKHILNTPGSLLSTTFDHSTAQQHPRALLVAALYNLGTEQQKSGDHDAASRSFDEGYIIAVTPVSSASGGRPPSAGGGANNNNNQTLYPPLTSSDPLLATLQSLASARAVASMRPPSAPLSKRPGGASFTRERHNSLIQSAGIPQNLKSGNGRRASSKTTSPRRASTATGLATTKDGDVSLSAPKSAGRINNSNAPPPAIGGSEYNKIPFVAVSMGTGPFIGNSSAESPFKKAAYGNLFPSSTRNNGDTAKISPRLTPLAPTAPKKDPDQKPPATASGSSRRGSRIDGGASSRHRLPSISRPATTTTRTGGNSSKNTTVSGSILMERSNGLKSLMSSLFSDLQGKITSQYGDRFKAARCIQCAWRCSRSRLETFNRRQIFLHSMYVSQKAAVTCLVSGLKCLLTKKRLHHSKAQFAASLAASAQSERQQRQAALRITAAMRAFVAKKREKNRLLRLLQLTHETKLTQYASAALIVQRWWPLIKFDKAYWRKRNAEIEAEREAKRLRELSDNAATSVQRMWRGVMARIYVRRYRDERATEKARTVERIRESIDCIRIVLKEMAAKKRRLLRQDADSERLNSPDTQEAELATKLVREAQRLVHANMIRMSRACRSIQRIFRAFLARRQLRIARRIAHTHEIIRIDKEFDEYKASRKIQCAVRQHQARAVVRRKKAYNGRAIIEKIWVLQRVGRGLLSRAYTKQSALMAAAMVGASLGSALSLVTKNRNSLEAYILWKLTQYTKATKQVESQKRKLDLQEEAKRELRRDYAASRIQRQVRGVQQRNKTKILVANHNHQKTILLAKIVRMQSFIRMVIQKARFAKLQEVDAKKKILQRLYVEASDARVESVRRDLENREEDARWTILTEEDRRFVALFTGSDNTEEEEMNVEDDADGIYD